jgi:TolB-like protein/Tfp pilus assembly protein PilF
MSLVSELRRRSVFRVAAAYLVVGWLLTEVLTTILPTLGAAEWTSRAVILIFAFGFIPAVVLSWFYEITPDGIKREHEVDRDDPSHARRMRRSDQVGIVTAIAIIILVGLFSARYTGDDVLDAVPEISDTSVAVLPFVNMSDDTDNEYFSDGLTETLLHMLTQIPDLKVAARTSSFAFKGQNRSVQDIARALEVAHVLEGSVQRVGDRVRITAQLIRASDGFHVWSENYDRTVDDIFAIQDEIAGKVGGALSRSLLGKESAPSLAGITTVSPDAYDLYLQARRERMTYSYGGLQAAEDLLKGALLIDPDFTEAKTELASSYLQQFETGLLDQRTALNRVIALSDQALDDRPDDPVAQSTSLFAKATLLSLQGDALAISDLVDKLETIVASAPSALEPRMLLVRAYTAMQRFEDCLPVLQGALSLDPFNPTLHYETGTAYMRLERWDDAKIALEKSLEIEPSQPNALTNLGIIALHAGDGAGFAKHFLNAIAVDPRDHELPGLLAIFLYQLGLNDIADDLRDRVLALNPTSEIAYQIELLRAKSSGDTEASMDAARRAIADDIQDRRFAFGGAVQHLLRTAAKEDRIEEELAWIEAQMPGIFDVDATRVRHKYRNAQGVALEAWLQLLPREEVVRRLDQVLIGVEALGLDMKKNPNMQLGVLVIRGQTEEAIKVALEHVFTESVAMHLNWRETFSQPHFEEIVADARVQEALQRWEDEEAALRGSVQSYFADMQASRSSRGATTSRTAASSAPSPGSRL